MPSDVRVTVTDRSVISALNKPGRPVYRWRDETMIKIANRAYDKSPKNNPLNARHRGSVVGTFKIGWRTRRHGNQHRVGLTVFNVADHAWYVENGRTASTKWQTFSWTKWKGEIHSVGGPRINAQGELIFGDKGRKTKARPGKHILKNATNYVMRQQTAGAYTPLA